MTLLTVRNIAHRGVVVMLNCLALEKMGMLSVQVYKNKLEVHLSAV